MPATCSPSLAKVAEGTDSANARRTGFYLGAGHTASARLGRVCRSWVEQVVIGRRSASLVVQKAQTKHIQGPLAAPVTDLASAQVLAHQMTFALDAARVG